MKHFLLTCCFLLFLTNVFAQINMSDSTVQVIAYWDKGEKQSYTITTEKIKVKGEDTTSKSMMKYKVDVTVIDSTAKSYTVEWQYKNIESTDTSKILQKISGISNNLKIIYKTDEMGMFKEIVNWKEIKENIHKACDILRKEYSGIPEMDKIIKQVENLYSTKEAIEASSIKDIQQFHTYHGAKYMLHEEISGRIQVPNIFGKEPFDADFSIYLDEINEEENNYIIRSAQEVDKEQLTNATYQYLTEVAKNLKVDPPKRSDLVDLKNETLVASRIHGTGWVIYSVLTKTVNSDDNTNIEERIIEID